MIDKLWKHVLTVREQSPLVHNITNFVVMNNTANALLAAGASPIMAHARPEIKQIVDIAGAVVINIGTPDEYWSDAMLVAAEHASSAGRPWILDPVGAGATSYRDELIQKLLAFRPDVIRGNASEIIALSTSNHAHTKGVDSTATSTEAKAIAKRTARQFQNIVCVSGAQDIITDGKKTAFIHNGHPLMTRITGMGCSATALIGAFSAVIENKFEATIAAMALLGIAGEISVKTAEGPGSFQVKILDKLYNITESEFTTHAKISIV